jgi:hypothetical protein
LRQDRKMDPQRSLHRNKISWQLDKGVTCSPSQ